MTRRRLLGLAAITSCGVAGIFISRRKESSAETIVASSTETTLPTAKEAKVSPQWFDGPQSFYYSTKPVKGIPQAWVDKKGLDVLRYANFIQDLGLKNITPYLVLYPHFKTRGRTNNSIPPRRLWSNIVPTLKVIDKIATHLNAKLKPFVSVYTSPSYNRAVRGRSRSQRLVNNSVSIQFYNVSSYTVGKVARQFRSAGHFKGGVGVYSSFVKIDTRGHNVDW